MHLTRIRGHRAILISLIMALALVFAACDNNEGVEVQDPAVGVEGGAVETDLETEAETEIDTEAEPIATEEAEAESVQTEVETQVMTDTEVITQTEVFTEATVTEVITETNVITDVAEAEIIDSDVMTESADLGTTTSPVQVQGSEQEGDAVAGFVIFVVTDAAGNEYLADASNERPIFAQSDTSQGMLQDENFEPISIDENISITEDLEQSLFGVVDQDGFQQLTINGYPVYRFVGEDADIQIITQEQGLTPLTREGDLGELSD
ncbi:hypothetical protein GC175_07250 [bacterium]|nr:hypothetical protein [bacterium]